MAESTIIAVYADGGVIDKNPSPVGGTWAWCHVDQHDLRLATDCGLLLADDALPLITNNVTELYALTLGLLALPEGWSGHVYSDSKITLGRLFWSWTWKIEKRVAAAVAELTAQHERETAVLRRMFNDDRRENERLRELNTRARWLLRCASTIGGPALWPEWHDAVTELLMKRLGEEGLL